MNDIEQFRNLMKGHTQSINTDQIIPKKTKQDNNHWTGVVVNNNDPDQVGRCQIKIYGYYDDLASTNIPWAVPDIQSMASTKGNFVVPDLNTIVRGYFDNGDETKPVYTSVAFNASYTDVVTNPFDWWYRTEDYPQTMVLFQTDQGDYLIMNKKTGEISFTHHTGSVTRINPDGSMDINTCIYSAGPAPMNVNVSGDINITTMGQCNISAMSGVNINTVTGKISLGNNLLKAPVCNLRNCLICGSPHQIGNTQVEA